MSLTAVVGAGVSVLLKDRYTSRLGIPISAWTMDLQLFFTIVGLLTSMVVLPFVIVPAVVHSTGRRLAPSKWWGKAGWVLLIAGYIAMPAGRSSLLVVLIAFMLIGAGSSAAFIRVDTASAPLLRALGYIVALGFPLLVVGAMYVSAGHAAADHRRGVVGTSFFSGTIVGPAVGTLRDVDGCVLRISADTYVTATGVVLLDASGPFTIGCPSA